MLENALAQLSPPSRREEEVRGAQVSGAVASCVLVWVTDIVLVWATDLTTQEGGREYVRIAREGAEEEVAEVPTNSDGKLPIQTVTVSGRGAH